MAEMKAVRIHDYGGVDELVLERAPIPEIGKNEVLIKVSYSSVNPVDCKVRTGFRRDTKPLKMPAILGIDVAGVIERTGPDVGDFKVGDKVICRADYYSKGGSYAEYVAVNASDVALAPKSISLREAAGLPVVAGTAWNSLFNTANVKRGQKVLILGASGGVGTIAVQLAKYAGAFVIGTTSARNMEMVRSLGADDVIDYTSVDFSKKVNDADMVLDTVGGDTLEKAYESVRKGGILVTIAVPMPDSDKAKKLGINAVRVQGDTDGKLLAKIAQLVDDGKLKVPIEREFELSEIREAHKLSQSGRSRGKIIIRVSP